MKTKTGNYLSGLCLDRAAELRADPERIERAWSAAGTRVLPVWRSRHIVATAEPPRVVFLSTADLGGVERLEDARVLLGTAAGASYFAVDVSALEAPLDELGLAGAHGLLSLRELAALVSREEGALLAYANGMTGWHARHRYCARCGSETMATQGGHVRACRSQNCEELHFPRIDPAVIMLVADDERCLLGRQPSWPPRIYSALAGFVEPGESLEEAVAREVREETGIEVERVSYHSSQPWPFPGSIMLGFVARPKTYRVQPVLEELEDARWFTREELRQGRLVELPTRISIARRLVEDWLSEG